MKILMPMIRKVDPALLAADIVGVQPMNLPAAGLHTHEDPANVYPYIVRRGFALFDDSKQTKLMVVYCESTFQRCDWHYIGNDFYFRNESDRTMFLLRWS